MKSNGWELHIVGAVGWDYEAFHIVANPLNGSDLTFCSPFAVQFGLEYEADYEVAQGLRLLHFAPMDLCFRSP